MLEQIPDSQPTLIEKLLIQRPIIPYEDLNMRGQIPRYLELFRDVGMNLSLMYGMSENGPRMVSMTPENAIRVATVGAGLTGFQTSETSILFTNNFNFTFNALKHVWMIALEEDVPPIFNNATDAQFTLADGKLSDFFRIRDGEIWIFDILAYSVLIRNNSTSTIHCRVWGFDYQSVVNSVAQAQ